jgi:hypothetical protein
MKRTTLLSLSIAVAAAACAEPDQDPTAPLLVPVFSHGAAASPNAAGGNFGAPLNAEEEVMPPGVEVENDSRARGNSIFRLSANGQSMTYQLIVANIENVTMAHIHQGAFGVNGPPVVWLYPSTTPGVLADAGGGRIDGMIASGSFTAADLVGPLAGQQLSALVALMRSGDTYVNVHTNDGVPPTNTGPGDFPAGEIRGQIRHRGH